MTDLVAVVALPDGTVVLVDEAPRPGAGGAPARTGGPALIARIEADARRRWVWWDGETPRRLARHGVGVARSWDLSVVHRLLVGGWRTDPGRVWAHVHGLGTAGLPTVEPADLFHQFDAEDAERPVRSDGYLNPEWVAGGWRDAPERAAAWAALAFDVHRRQRDVLGGEHHRLTTAHAESGAEMVAAELETEGLPLDRQEAERIIAGVIGPRPHNATEHAGLLERLDHTVLDLAPPPGGFDLRNPEQMKSLLRRVGVEVPDTRAWRLERMADEHPIIPAILNWRRAERIRTTFGYDWLDEHVGADGRLRGSWTSSDGAAGRMTATAGLHNLPAELRPAIAAEPDHVFVRADLGQIEPRVLAAVSGDSVLARATHDDDMYAPVATRLGVEREIAKVAVLGAMYGQTTGVGAEALRGLERAYPVAMGYLRSADESAQGGNDLRTYGGRLVRMSGTVDDTMSERDARASAAARGRYGRNAMVQGAAAEFFKTWSVLVRARGADLGARIVLCLHDELLVHVPADAGAATVRLVEDCLQEAARRWAPATEVPVRFLSDTSVVTRWSDAK